MKNTRCPWGLSLLTLSVLSLNAQAAEISNVQTTLSNLTYRLVDLNPNDGIAPAILFQWGGLQGTTYAGSGNFVYAEKPIAEYINDGAWTGASPVTTAPSVFDNTGTIPLESYYTSATGSITGNTLKTQASLDSSLVDANAQSYSNPPYTTTYTQYNPATNTTDTYNYTSSRQDLYSRGNSFARIESTQAALALTPNTMLIIEGDATASGTVNASDAKARTEAFASQYASNATYFNNDVYGSAYGAVSVSLTYSNGEVQDENGNVLIPATDSSMTQGGTSYTNQSSTYGMSVGGTYYGPDGKIYIGQGLGNDGTELVPDANGNASFSDGEHFSVALTNFSGKARLALLDLSILASASQSQSSSAYSETKELISSVPYVSPTPNPTIPEPSTYALMGLGLMGIAAAARRQRPTQRG